MILSAAANKAHPMQRTARQIKERAAAMRMDPNRSVTLPLHERILKTWQQERPAMWAELQKAGVADDAAYLAQQEMWDRQEELLDAGMNVTDARELAEQEHLLLTPETYSPIEPAPAPELQTS